MNNTQRREGGAEEGLWSVVSVFQKNKNASTRCKIIPTAENGAVQKRFFVVVFFFKVWVISEPAVPAESLSRPQEDSLTLCRSSGARLGNSFITGSVQRDAGGPRCGRPPQRLTRPHSDNTQVYRHRLQLPILHQPLPPLINPTHKGLHDRELQKKSDTFVAKIGRAVEFFLPPPPRRSSLHPRNICKLRNHC